MREPKDFEILERDLRDLADSLSYPEPRDVSYRVRHAITAAPTRRPSGAARVAHALGAGIGVFLTALAVLLAASPGAREAIADFLGVSGVKIHVTESPRPTPLEIGELDLGRPMSLEAARNAVDFDLAVPTDAGLGPPDGVFIDNVPIGGVVAFVYKPSPELPETIHEVGAVFMQFRAGLEELLLKKIAGPGTRVVPVDVGDLGYWVTGRPHEILYRVNGQIVADRTRLATNTLLWESGGITYRFESDLPLARAVEIARTVD